LVAAIAHGQEEKSSK